MKLFIPLTEVVASRIRKYICNSNNRVDFVTELLRRVLKGKTVTNGP
jgi:hypothetical protein